MTSLPDIQNTPQAIPNFHMNAIDRYEDWFPTRHLLQNLCQMMGKTKLATLPRQPEWGEVTLPLTPTGFTTGILPAPINVRAGEALSAGFELRLNVASGVLQGLRSDGSTAEMVIIDGLSVADLYTSYRALLDTLGLGYLRLNSRQQEMATTFLFEEDTADRSFDGAAAARFFDTTRWAHGRLNRFLAPFRGKKYLPHFFWGTFDVTGILYSGRPEPWPYEEGVIEQAAFDECSVEFGFWPGDQRYADPAFFVLPYPFASDDLSKEVSTSIGGSWNATLGEFLYPLDELFARDDPEAALDEFLQATFQAIAHHNTWERLDWLTQPLS
jgi:hypothetical protein